MNDRDAREAWSPWDMGSNPGAPPPFDPGLEAIRADFRARKAAERGDLGDRISEAGFALMIVGAAVALLWAVLR